MLTAGSVIVGIGGDGAEAEMDVTKNSISVVAISIFTKNLSQIKKSVKLTCLTTLLLIRGD
jgi:hypothetical protein